jgi:hypothetical protein
MAIFDSQGVKREDHCPYPWQKEVNEASVWSVNQKGRRRRINTGPALRRFEVRPCLCREALKDVLSAYGITAKI